ncbi:MAG: hypothetical protein ACREIS_01760 [Nitrospiraceae bacterium]
MHHVWLLIRGLALAVGGLAAFLLPLSHGAGTAQAAQAVKQAKAPTTKSSAATSAAQRYTEAVAGGDPISAGRFDFACQFRLVSGSPKRVTAFPPDSDLLYSACWAQLTHAHAVAVEQRDLGMDVMWPGKGSLVFLGEDLTRYPASVFVMDLLGLSPPAGGLRVELIDSTPLPASSFRLREDAPLVSAPATLVRVRVTYKDPLTSPVTYAPGAYRWTNTVKRPRQALKAITVKWVVLSNLRKLGFPGDAAVVNLPVVDVTDGHPAVPFLTETGGSVPNSASWWEPADAPGLLIAAVGRAAQFPEQQDRIALLNRVLIVDPFQRDALTALTRDLYQAILNEAGSVRTLQISDKILAARLSEFFWDTSAQADRLDLSLGMEVGGLSKPTPADYLYRMIPAMEKLAQVRPEDLENRLRLGTAYRWNNDQLAAIATHEAVVKDTAPERATVRARALIQLAWSRIARVAWNRTSADPGIQQAYQEAQEALKLTDQPLDKFAAAYTMAYSLVFAPNRENRAILEHLTEAHRWYRELAGTSQESWRYLLSNDTLKAVIDADPAFKPLLASSEKF